MSATDGSVLGVTKVVDHGPDAQHWNLVILGDGYQAAQLATYHADVDSFVQYFQSVEPFHQLWGKINIHRVDVTSTDSGGDDPPFCPTGAAAEPVTGVTSATYFDATFCYMGIDRRLLAGDSMLALTVARNQVPAVHVTLVIVNSPLQSGGSGGSVAWCSSEPLASRVAVHEIAHAYFKLDDEYGLSPPLPVLGVGQAINISTDINRATTEWRDLILPGTPLPTMPNPYAGSDNTDPSPVPPGTVGLFEGAGHAFQGIYRSEYDCTMRHRWEPFCQVCQRRIRAMLAPFSGGAMSWEINGNGGTHPATDFLGTTDNQPLVLKTNNVEQVRLTTLETRFKSNVNFEAKLIFQRGSFPAFGRVWPNSLAPGLNLSNGGTDPHISIDSRGNVGVGTGKPDARLEVYDGHLTLQAANKSNSSPGEIIFRASTGVFKARIWSEPKAGTGLHLSNGGNKPNVTVDDRGNVGIDTTNPGAKLEVGNGNLLVNRSGSLLLRGAAQDAGAIVFQNAAGAQKGRVWSEPAAGAGLYLSSAGTAPAVAIHATGNVGIGTGVNPPSSKLDVRASTPGGVVLTANNTADGAALFATATTTRLSSAVSMNFGTGAGVQGTAIQTSTTSFGVVGLAGPTAFSPTAAFAGGIGVLGYSPQGSGVAGATDGQGGVGNGVEGLHAGGAGAAIHGRTTSGTGTAVYGENLAGGFAGQFVGGVAVQGRLSASVKAFRIDHPLDPANKYLSHSSVESPDMMNVYNGNVITDAEGEAVVELPAYFEALNRDFRYQLTVIGKLALVAVAREVKDNRFVIRSDRPKVKVSWQVTGVRKDPYAKACRIQVEEEKSAAERGRYLHPEHYPAASDKPDAQQPIGALAGLIVNYKPSVKKRSAKGATQPVAKTGVSIKRKAR